MKSLFITGTDTGIGKTVITGLLARFLLDKGLRVVTQKWVATGSGRFSDDIRKHLNLMGKGPLYIKEYAEYVSPYILKYPFSPHLAAAIEGIKIDAARIEKSFKHLQKDFDFVLVEGTGGCLVPYNEKNLILDIVRKLDIPILIVAGNRLGAINHTLLTVEAIKRRGMRLAGIVFNNVKRKEDARVLRDNPRIIGKFTRMPILGILPYRKNKRHLAKDFAPIGEKIYLTAIDRVG